MRVSSIFISNLCLAAPDIAFPRTGALLFAVAFDAEAVSAGTATAAPRPASTASRRVIFGIQHSYKMYNCHMIRSEERRVGKECVVRLDVGGRRRVKKTKNIQKSRNIQKRH